MTLAGQVIGIPTLAAISPQLGGRILHRPRYGDHLQPGAERDHHYARVPVGKIIWSFGVTRKAGTAPGELNTPDGFDLLLPDGSTPTHPTTG